MLDDEEIRGVLAHEMSHIKHRDILISTIVATFATAVSYLANILQWAAIFGGGRDNDDDNGGGGGIIGLLASIIIAPLAATMVQLAVSRTREYMADDAGGRLTGDPLALASALAKISMPMHTEEYCPALRSRRLTCVSLTPLPELVAVLPNSSVPTRRHRIELHDCKSWTENYIVDKRKAMLERA